MESYFSKDPNDRKPRNSITSYKRGSITSVKRNSILSNKRMSFHQCSHPSKFPYLCQLDQRTLDSINKTYNNTNSCAAGTAAETQNSHTGTALVQNGSEIIGIAAPVEMNSLNMIKQPNELTALNQQQMQQH